MGAGRHVAVRPVGRGYRRATLYVPAALVVVALLALGLSAFRSDGGKDCEREQIVRITTVPEVAALTREALLEPIPLGGGTCARGQVTELSPLQAVGQLQALPAQELPDIWVPDTSLWSSFTDSDVRLTAQGNLASTPIVMAVAKTVAERFGWLDKPSSWGASLATALSAGQALAVPTPGDGIDILSTSVIIRSLGGSDRAQAAVLQAVLTSAREVWTPGDGLLAAQENRDVAPLVAAREQEVLATNQARQGSGLVAIYPTDGTPNLDYPLLQVGDKIGVSKQAVDAVVGRLTSAQVRATMLSAGFRDPQGGAPPDAGAATGTSRAVPKDLKFDAAQVNAAQKQVASLQRPSKMLAVIDVSTSMKAPVGNSTRIALAVTTTKSALALFPDTFSVGLWAFAAKISGAQDYLPLAPTQELSTAAADGTTQRAQLSALIDTLPNRLSGGGTALYATTLAAVRNARATYDPGAVNSVVILTDGANEDDGGIQLPALLDTLAAENDPNRPVQVFAVGLGSTVDLTALQQIAAATNGVAYSAVSPADIQRVLFDALQHRQ